MPTNLLAKDPTPVEGAKSAPRDLLAKENVGDAPKAAEIVDKAQDLKLDPARQQELRNKVLSAQGYDTDVDYGFTPEKIDALAAPPKAGLMNTPELMKKAGSSIEKAFGEGGAFKPRELGELSPDRLPGEIKEGLSRQWAELKKLPAQVALQRADNPLEAKLALEQVYGKGNAGQDKGGRWWAKIDGKKHAIFGAGQGLQTGAEKLGSGVLASAPELAGSLGAEALIGLPAAQVTMGASLPLAWFAGGAVGKGLDEAIKGAQGVRSKNPEEETKALMEGGTLNAIGAGLPKAIAMGAKGAANLVPKYMTNMTTKGRAMVNELLSQGYVPPLASAAPGMTALQYDMSVRNAVMGNPTEAANAAKLKHEMTQLFRDSGLSVKDSEAVMQKLIDKREAISTGKEGEALTDVSKAYRKQLDASAEQSLKNAKQLADKEVSRYRKLAASSQPIAKDVAAGISQERQNVSAAYKLAYGHVDQMTEGKPFAPLYLLKNKIEDLVKAAPPDSVPLIYKNILAMPDAEVSIMKMHDIRSKLWGEASSSNLTPGSKEFGYAEAARMADASLRVAEREMKGTPYEGAIPFMRKVDEGYSKAIAPFKDTTINKLVQDSKTGLQPNPEVTANVLAEYGHDERTRFILKSLTPEARRKVGSAYMKSIFEDAERMTGGNEFMTSGRALLKSVNDRGTMLHELYDPIYGPGFVDKFKQATKELASVDGNIRDVDKLEARMAGLGPGAVLDALNTHLEALKHIDAFVKNNPMAGLASDNPQVIDRALRTLVRPGDEATLAFAANKLDPNSKEWKMVQDWALKDIISKAVHQTASGVDIITGRSLKEALRGYTEKQQDLLFPKDMLPKLAKIADKADFLFPTRTSDFGGSLAAAEIKGNVPQSLWADMKYLKLKLLGWIVEKPAILDYLANGLDNPDLAKRTQAEAVLGRVVRAAVAEQGAGPGRKKAPEEPTE